MPKRVKLFEVGKYPQGVFPEAEVATIFNATTGPIPAQFAHTSKLEQAGKDPVILGEFSNLEIDDGVIFADLEFNEKGSQYYEDGIINACSVEISGGKIDRVAILPVGVTPQIAGAEFESSGQLVFGGELEFEDNSITAEQAIDALENIDIQTLTEDLIDKLYEIIWDKTDTARIVRKLTEAGYIIEKKTSEFEGKSSDDIAKAVKHKLTLEFNAKDAGEKKFMELKNKGVITPAMESVGLTAEFMAALQLSHTNGDRLEFSENKFDAYKILLDVFDSMEPLVNMKGVVSEFQLDTNSATNNMERYMKEAEERSKNLK